MPSPPSRPIRLQPFLSPSKPFTSPQTASEECRGEGVERCLHPRPVPYACTPFSLHLNHLLLLRLPLQRRWIKRCSTSITHVHFEYIALQLSNYFQPNVRMILLLTSLVTFSFKALNRLEIGSLRSSEKFSLVILSVKI